MKYIYQFVILLIVGCMGFLLGKCTYKQVPEVRTVTIRDTIPGKIPPPIIRYIPVPEFVDTAAILADHFSEKVYHDTIIKYPELEVQVNDIVSQNKIMDRNVIVDFRKPIPSKNTLLFDSYFAKGNMSFMAGYRRNQFSYKIGYDVLNRAVVGGFSFDLIKW